MKNQIIHYYLFHKQIEKIFENGYNPFYINNNNQVKLEKFYVIDKILVEQWKNNCQYTTYKFNFEQIEIDSNNKKYISLLEKKYDKTNKELKLNDIQSSFWNGLVDYQWCSKNILSLENFDYLLDEKTYEYFKVNLQFDNQKSDITGIITNDKIILLYNNMFQIKFLYYGDIIRPEGGTNRELIQLTANFSQIYNGNIDVNYTMLVYNGFKNIICSNINEVFNIFERHNIRLLEEETIHFNVYYDNGSFETHKFILKNENLSCRTLEQNYRSVNYQKLNPNLFRLIGLANVGATCYMNATLQCFINVPMLTRYLLTDYNYKQINQNSKLYELTSAYCHLLFHVCCDESVVKYYEPQNFKDVISWKNPLFRGINANDSKDLINFMLEEMNQELIKLNPQNNNNNNLRNNNQINHSDKYSVLNNFKFDFAKNNNSIIAKNFFFIIETKTQCCNCKINKYNFQVLYLLEFPLEIVFNFCISNNIKCFDTNINKKYISLKSCIKQYMLPNKFVGDNKLYCNGCSVLAEAYSQTRIYSLPKTLIIILNRGKGKVFDCFVDFPLELDLSNYVLCPQSITKYNLSGVITHLGESGMGGHFIALCKHRLNGNWYKYNDSIVTPIQDPISEFKLGTPYILFYESCDSKNNVLFDGKNVDANSFINGNIMFKNNLNKNMTIVNSMNKNNMKIKNNIFNPQTMNNGNLSSYNKFKNNFNMNLMNNNNFNINMNNNVNGIKNNMNFTNNNNFTNNMYNNMNFMNNNMENNIIMFNNMNNNMNGINNNINSNNLNNNMNFINNNMNINNHVNNNNINGMNNNMNGMNNNINGINNNMNFINNNNFNNNIESNINFMNNNNMNGMNNNMNFISNNNFNSNMNNMNLNYKNNNFNNRNVQNFNSFNYNNNFMNNMNNNFSNNFMNNKMINMNMNSFQ